MGSKFVRRVFKPSVEDVLENLEKKPKQEPRPGDFCTRCKHKKPTRKAGKEFLCKDCRE